MFKYHELNYRIHYYCSICRKIYQRKEIKGKIPFCPDCHKMLRRSARKKNEKLLKRIVI